MRARRQRFPSDHGLVIRMALVGLATPLVVLAGLAAVVEFAEWKVIGVVAVALGTGAVMAVHERVEAAARGRRLSPSEAPELHAIVERLCVVGDLAKPAIVLEAERQPNSWIEGTMRGGFRLH